MIAITRRASATEDSPGRAGEFAGFLRGFDWSGTPLGPGERWPASLKTMAAVVSASRQPLMLWWGPQLVQLYNDGVRPILGDKHPASMGRPAAEVWSQVWEVLGPRAERVLQGGEAARSDELVLPVVRRGVRVQGCFSLSYSPVPDDEGRIGGVLVAMQETSEAVAQARGLQLLRELGERTVEATTAHEVCRAAATVLRGHTADFPFSCFYLFDDDAPCRRVRLVACAGFDGQYGRANPMVIDLDGPSDGRGWPLEQALQRGHVHVVERLADRFVALPRTPDADPPQCAVIVPLCGPARDTPYGFFIAAVSPHRHLDEDYASVVRLVATLVERALASALAVEDAGRRARVQAELDQAKEAFFTNISHELRTPLTLMLGPTRDALVSPARVLRGADLEAVYRNQVRLHGLVNTLLDFSRIEGGHLRPTAEITDLAAYTRDLANAFRPAIQRAGLRLEVDCPSVELPVRVDRSMWEKIIGHLLSNALKFTFEGRVTVRLRRTGGLVELTVRDTGVGIAPDDLPRLFTRFHRAPATRSRSHEGPGLGLALVQQLCKIHGGTVWAQSELGRGATFTVQIPAGPVAQPSPGWALPSRRSTDFDETVAVIEEAWDVPLDDVEAAHGTDGARVLVVDDNADMRAYLKRILGQRWSVDTAADGAVALHRIREHRPDLVIADLVMPHVDGVALLRAIRSDPAIADLPIIAIAARAGENHRAEDIDAGVDDYLVKPFASRELVARVGMHLQISRLRRAVERERSLLIHVFEQAPVAIAVLRGPEFVFELANTRYRSAFACPDPVGKRVRDVLPEPGGLWGEFESVYSSGRTLVAHDHLVQFDRQGDGSLTSAYFDFTLTALRDEHDAITGVVAIAVEVTAQVESRLAMERAASTEQSLRAQAEAASRTKDDFLALLGHELRNPLAPMLSALEVMRLRGDASRELEILGRQVAHLTRLVDDLLDVSRIARGAIELRLTDLELHDVVAAAIEVAAPLVERRGHDVQVQVPTHGAAVNVDPERMTQVVANLLTNAAKYSDQAKTIELRAEVSEGWVRLHIKDEGTGIAPEMLGRVFDAFVQQPQTLARSLGGLGIGLTIVRSLVHLHGGHVRVTSDGLGRGSEFVLELPHVPAPVCAARPAGPASFVVPAARRPIRVLVVDDNEDAAELLQSLLTRIGYVALVAHDGDAALARARAFDPDIAILDIGLPGMDGYELAAQLRTERDGRAPIRMLAVTGYGQPSDRSRSAQAGFEHHLVKPVDLDALQRVLVQLL